MNWDAIGAIGEIAGALAVILTLFYLAIQVRESTKMNSSMIREQRTASSQAVIFKAIDLSDLHAKIFKGEKLTSSEHVKLSMLFRAEFRGYEAYIHQYQNNLFDEDEWAAMCELIKGRMEDPYVKQLWESDKTRFSLKLQNLVNEFIR